MLKKDSIRHQVNFAVLGTTSLILCLTTVILVTRHAQFSERRALDLNTLVSISLTRLLDEIRARRAPGVVRGRS